MPSGDPFAGPFQTYAPEDYRYTQQVPMQGQQGGGGDWWGQNAPPQQAQTQEGGGNPLRPGMSPDEFRGALNQFAQSRGYGPVSDSAFQTWLGYYNDYGQRDPNYLWMRLNDTGEFGGRDTYGGGGGGNAQAQMEALQNDPGYQARLREGEQGIQRNAAARGTLLTGGLQKGLERFRQDYASNEFGNVFNRNLALANLGQTSIGRIGGYAGDYGQGAANAIYGQGNAAAQGTATGANAWTGTLGNLGQIAAQYPWGQQQYPYGGGGYPYPYSGVTPQQSAWWGGGNQGPVV